ncbi:MAG TPA: SprT family zinc-dependent metalloprotease [Lachnospiraceae bacterium]|nr:SprT family zinc-dependent metalloprotease [Lachnospiraceae bacterium]
MIDITESSILYSDIQVPYQVKRTKRRSLAISIQPGGKVEIKIPLFLTEQELLRFISKKKAWIHDTYLKQVKREISGITLAEGVKIPFLDQEYTLRIQCDSQRSSALVRATQDELVVLTPNSTNEFIKECVISWYKRNARIILTRSVDYYASRMGIDYGRISVKNQKSCWGSCSGKGNLNFNWKLAMMPQKVLDYVVVHELAHRKEMNHSQNFWKEVAAVIPEYMELRAWLKTNGGQYEFR